MNPLLLTLCAVLLAPCPELAQDRPGVKILQVPCARAIHAHQAADYRISLVKVLEISSCGFTYEDLKERTINVEPILFDAGDTASTRMLDAVGFGNKRMNVFMRCAVPMKGAFGILVYCAHCRAGFLLETKNR